MLGTVFYQDTVGIDYNEFMRIYKDDLKGKEGIYVVQTNLEQDQMKVNTSRYQIRTRSGKKSWGGPVVKVRKTTNFAGRFAAYASHKGGSRSSLTDQGSDFTCFIFESEIIIYYREVIYRLIREAAASNA